MANTLLSNLSSFFVTRGPTLISGEDLRNFFNMILGARSGITALANGGIPGATQLYVGWNEVDTVASDSDSCILPPAIVNAFVMVLNLGGHTLDIYNQQLNYQTGLTDTITPHGSVTPNAGNAAVTLATGHCSLFFCSTLGSWKQVADFS
jgi:hypothetical protein